MREPRAPTARSIRCSPVFSTPGALSDVLAQALDRFPRDLFKARRDRDRKDAAFHATVRVGTAAEGAAIKEGSYLVQRARSSRSSAAGRKPVAVRDGKGDGGDPREARPHHPQPDRRSRRRSRGSARPGE